MESHLYTSFFLVRLIESIYLQRMRSTGDIQFFVCRSRIIPEPPFPSQGIAGSGDEIDRNPFFDPIIKFLMEYNLLCL